MKLKKYAQLIMNVAREHPDADVIYASDEEGNSHDLVQFKPTPGHFEDGEFDSEGEVNAVCVN